MGGEAGTTICSHQCDHGRGLRSACGRWDAGGEAGCLGTSLPYSTAITGLGTQTCTQCHAWIQVWQEGMLEPQTRFMWPRLQPVNHWDLALPKAEKKVG